MAALPSRGAAGTRQLSEVSVPFIFFMNILVRDGVSMFDKVINTISEIFDAETGSYIGRAYFTLTDEAEKNFLNYLNYASVPPLLTLYNFDILNAPKNYAPDPYKKGKRIATLFASARDRDSNVYFQLAMRLKFDVLTRGNMSKNEYHADSVEMSNIEPISMNFLV